MTILSRNSGIIEQLSSNRKMIDDIKLKQFIGNDIYNPVVIQRYLPDGSPTDHDIEGEHSIYLGYDYYGVEGSIEYIPKYRNLGAWAKPFFKVWSKPDKSGLSDGGELNAILDYDYLFNLNNLGLKYNINGGDSKMSDSSVDRFYIKIYILALDDGDMNINLTTGVLV